jgi:hypothetical protein
MNQKLAHLGAIAAALSAQGNQYYIDRPYRISKPNNGAKSFAQPVQKLHKFIIHGVSIMAANRKTAIKIYNLNHKSK